VSLWGQVKERRITQIVLAYLAGGYVALTVVDQVVDREVLPDVAYRVAGTLYLFGIAFALILGWYHGEKGDQKASFPEIVMLVIVSLATLGSTGMIIRGHLQDVAVASALDTSTMDLRRLAVTYFEDGSADGSLGAVADAITEGLIGSLSQVQELDVVSRNGSESVRGEDLTPDSIGRIFNAGTLIEGSVGQANDELLVTVRLVDGQSGIQVQRDQYTWPADELASVGEELTQEVARALRIHLGEELRLRESRSAAPSTAAWLHMARAEKALKDGLAAMQRFDGEAASDAFAIAAREAAAAREADEDWVEPVVLLGRVTYEGYPLSADAFATIEEAISLATEALEIEANDAAALELRGTARYRLWLGGGAEEGDESDRLFEAARADLVQSLNLDRSRANVNSVLSHLYLQVSDWSQAVLAARQAYEGDAYLAAADGVLFRLYQASYDLGDYEEADRWCREANRRFPEDFRFVRCQLQVMTMPRAEPDVETAWALYNDFVEMQGEGEENFLAGITKMFVGGVIGRAGLPDSANAVFARSRLDRDIDPEGEQISVEAAMRSVMGDVEGSIDALEEFMVRSPGHFPGEHWWFQNLQGNPDFERLQAVR
jgi:TolB-like protein